MYMYFIVIHSVFMHQLPCEQRCGCLLLPQANASSCMGAGPQVIALHPGFGVEIRSVFNYKKQMQAPHKYYHTQRTHRS
jgi:hypothetical protein